MENQSHIDLTLWQVHETQEDRDLIFRTTNGRVFYCHINRSHFSARLEVLSSTSSALTSSARPARSRTTST
ncbi:hypothetical protein F5Y03DRAFT_378555 [Xylaria venustula]|nr:hypothetical protein F5Y03DRAFT_378555 [Xylaria venustula]